MPTEFGQSSDEQESFTIREAPPHLEASSTPKLTGHDVKELKDIEGPLENIPEDAQIDKFETDELPGLFALLPGKTVILFAVSVTKVKCILRSKVLLQRQVKYITGSEKMK